MAFDHKQVGFSLVELSIVLVILGLLTGGVLTGQSLIRAAELRSIRVEADSFRSATHQFRDKYRAIPGDMLNATDFWGAAHSDPATCATTVGTGTQTCNGNASGIIGDDTDLRYERFRFWQQLVNAGLLEGSYTGVGNGNQGAESYNVPRSKFSNGLWYTAYREAGGNNSTSFFGGVGYGNYVQVGAYSEGFSPIEPLLTPEEAWNIDTKFDDGQPAVGRIIATRPYDCTDNTETDPSNNGSVQYDLALGTVACGLLFTQTY